MMIRHAFTREDFSPRVLSVVENEGHELHQWLLALILFPICRGSVGPILLTNRDRRFAGTAAKQGKKIAMENQAQDKNDNQSSDTEVEPSKLHPSGATVVEAVFDIVTAATRCPAHFRMPPDFEQKSRIHSMPTTAKGRWLLNKKYLTSVSPAWAAIFGPLRAPSQSLRSAPC